MLQRTVHPGTQLPTVIISWQSYFPPRDRWNEKDEICPGQIDSHYLKISLFVAQFEFHLHKHEIDIPVSHLQI